MAMYDWNTIRSNIFAGESGGDYNALYGYSNRPGGQFSGTNLTNMTIDQALQFSDPAGPYGQWVKGQIGRVATPMGAYQVVGKTLRAAKQGLGLSGNEMMTPEMQERIGKWIYETQGTGAWAGYRPDAGARRLAGDTMAALGLNKGAPMAAGLLGGVPEEKKPFYKNPDFWSKLAIGLEGMTMNPNQALIQGAANSIQQRAENKLSAEQKNRTVAWLRANGRDDLATAVESGVLGGKDAASLYYTPAKDERTALQQNYEYAIAQGMTPEQARQWVSSGTSVNVDLGAKGDAKFAETFAAADAKALGDVATAGIQAQRNLGMIDELGQRLAAAPAGAEGAIKGWLGNYGINTEGLDNVQAAQALINQMVPAQRPPGSGPMSDADLDLFKKSLPRIMNTPGGNQLIIETMRRINQYDAEGAAIVQELRAGKIDQATAFERLQNRAYPLPSLQGLPPAPGTTPTGGTTGTSGGINWSVK